MNAGAKLQFYAACRQGISDCPGIGNGAREPIEFGHHQCVAAAHCCEGMIQTGACAIGPSEAVIGINSIRRVVRASLEPKVRGAP